MPKNKKRNTPHRGGSGGGGSGAAAATAATAGKRVSPPPASRLPAGLAEAFGRGHGGSCSPFPSDIGVGGAPVWAGGLPFPACSAGRTSRYLDLASEPNSWALAVGAGRGRMGPGPASGLRPRVTRGWAGGGLISEAGACSRALPDGESGGARSGVQAVTGRF